MQLVTGPDRMGSCAYLAFGTEHFRHFPGRGYGVTFLLDCTRNQVTMYAT